MTRTTKTTLETLTAAAVAVPLLVGCGQGGQSTEAGSPVPSGTAVPASSATSEPTRAASSAAVSNPAAPGEGTSASGPSTATGSPAATGTADAGTTLPAVADPCAGACTETARIKVTHPTFGPLEIVSYERITRADSAPQGKQASYAVYRGATAVGYVAAPADSEVISFGPSPVLGDQLWEIAQGSPVDRYGNIFLSYGSGVTVISPSPGGFDSHGTMPPGNDGKQHPFARAGVKIDASGGSTIVQDVVDEKGMKTGKTVQWAWDGTAFVAQR